jgi:hypothetical protein
MNISSAHILSSHSLSMKKILLILVSFALTLGSASAQIFVEDFDYSPGALGSNGGWGSTFTFATNAVSGTAPGTVVTGNVDNSANPFDPIGNSLSMAIDQPNVNKFSVGQRIVGNTSDTLYFSFMARTSSSGGLPFFTFQESNIDGGYTNFEFGSNTSGQWVIGGSYGFGGPGGNGTSASAGSGTSAFAHDASFFVVGKIVTSNTVFDTVFVQIYNDSGVVSSTDNLSISNTLNHSVNRTDARGSNILRIINSSAILDGIRIGDTYASVVPEPSSASLLIGLGAGAMILLRRRRRVS